MTAEEFFRNKIKEETQLKEPITLSKIILNAEQTMRWANEFAKIKVKNALEDLLNAECYSEYLPDKIKEAIFDIDNPL
jgi:hypothetical protein